MNLRFFFAVSVAVAACGESSAINAGDAGKGAQPDGGSSVIGASCVPLDEGDASFGGFDEEELSIYDKHPQCPGAVCLVVHFRGRATCAYGQDAGAQGCTASGAPVVPAVDAQCTDRRAGTTNLCSCRCANAAGKTDDGATYCTCAGDFVCTQLVSSLGGANDTLSGAYCIRQGTEYVRDASCAKTCDPQTAPCP